MSHYPFSFLSCLSKYKKKIPLLAVANSLQLYCTSWACFSTGWPRFLLAWSQHESQWTFPCRSTVLNYQANTLNSTLMTCCLNCKLLTAPHFMQEQCFTKALRFLFLGFYLWLVCLCSFLLQQLVLSLPAPFWNHGYALLREHPEWSV